jgi:prepilin-type N-terminal cleavage/methylation domain-containing protein
MFKLKTSTHKSGFTLLEVLLVVAIIAILAGIVILAINPSKQLGDTNNAQRASDVTTILNSVYQYALDNKGTLPASITSTNTQICATGGTCTGLIDLTVLTTSQKYLAAIPRDPQCATVCTSAVNGTGYQIMKSANNRVTVTSMHPENGAVITVTR